MFKWTNKCCDFVQNLWKFSKVSTGSVCMSASFLISCLGIYRPLVYLPSTMKVVLVLLVFLTLSDEIYLKHHKLYKHHKYNRLRKPYNHHKYNGHHKPGIKKSWDHSLIGLDFLAFQNNHLGSKSKV